jgi:Plasmid pRiA4b ORF-3-like protein.
MVYKFTILSDEVDNFVRVITIDSEATFFDLHNAILDSVNYEKNQMTSFFMCSDDWEKGQEVTLVEMDSSSEYDNLVMEDTKLEELISEENQKLLYVFDMMSDRVFFIEMTDIIPRQSLSKPVCELSEGNAPTQILADDGLSVAPKTTLDENFYGDEDFELDELDEEGFGEMNFDDNSLFSEDPKF